MIHIEQCSVQNNIRQLNNTLQLLSSSGNIDLTDTGLIEMTENAIFRMKEHAVLSVHKNAITRIDNGKSIRYQTRCLGKKPRFTTYEGLINKLYTMYGFESDDLTVEAVFKKAIVEKANTENNDANTIDKIWGDYKRYITSDFSTKRVDKLTDIDLKAYTQNMVHTLQPTDKGFLAYKGVLNVIFNYAMSHHLISTNPVIAINNKVYKKSCRRSKKKEDEKILSMEEINVIKKAVRQYMTYKRYNGYFINGYVILLAIETGMRAGELCALKWSDCDFIQKQIHIHAQQLAHKQEGGKQYYYADWTKDEKGISNGGRYFPITDSISAILSELKALQENMNIHSEFIFVHTNGEWIKTDAYETCLRRFMTSLDMKVTNNHSFRMSLNSNVLIPLGIPVTERARLLGHSVETNLKYYSFARKGNMDDIRNILNQVSHPLNGQKSPTLVPFPKREESA